MSAIFGEKLFFKQPDWGDVELIVTGDEFDARYHTQDGIPVVFDVAIDQYCYALIEDDELKSSGIPIVQDPPLSVLNDYIANSTSRTPQLLRTLGQEQGLLSGRRISQGKITGLTIMVEFDDVTSPVTRQQVEFLLNDPGYSDYGNFCSVRDYFYLMSCGRLDYQNVVLGPIKLAHGRRYYQDVLLLKEVLDHVVNELKIDLTKFDSKGEGIVDAINILYAGRTQYQGHLWPHNFQVDLEYGDMHIQNYMISSYGSQGSDLSIGTFCHETGHLLCRFPDMYDYGVRDGDYVPSRGLGRYCLMGAGNHLQRGKIPSPICAYLRDLVGWVHEEVSLDDGGTFNVCHGDYGRVFKYHSPKSSEYFMVENRTHLGLDVALPSSGLAVYHCDINGSNEWQKGSLKRHYQCSLLQADGRSDLEKDRNGGDRGDLYGQTNGIALSRTTYPSSQLWDMSDSGLVISNISEPSTYMSFEVAIPKGDVSH